MTFSSKQDKILFVREEKRAQVLEISARFFFWGGSWLFELHQHCA